MKHNVINRWLICMFIFCLSLPLTAVEPVKGHKPINTSLLKVEETAYIVHPLGLKNVTGKMVWGNSFKPLPIGAGLDPEKGIFYWLIGPGYLGDFSFRFSSADGREKNLTIRITPRFCNSAPLKPVSPKTTRPSSSGIPFGDFSTPLNGAAVSSSLAVTGWALDDEAVTSVKIYRGATDNLIYIGDADFVEGARPDVETAYPGYPNNSAAGWGYMLLSNFLPNSGNGTFTLHAVARDNRGNTVSLGSKTIICNNADAIKPFGAIDAPEQGGAASKNTPQRLAHDRPGNPHGRSLL